MSSGIDRAIEGAGGALALAKLLQGGAKVHAFSDPILKAAYKEARKTYRDKARIVAKQMERQGLSLILKSPE